MPYTGDKTDVDALVKYTIDLENENDDLKKEIIRYRTTLQVTLNFFRVMLGMESK